MDIGLVRHAYLDVSFAAKSRVGVDVFSLREDSAHDIEGLVPGLFAREMEEVDDGADNERLEFPAFVFQDSICAIPSQFGGPVGTGQLHEASRRGQRPGRDAQGLNIDKAEAMKIPSENQGII